MGDPPRVIKYPLTERLDFDQDPQSESSMLNKKALCSYQLEIRRATRSTSAAESVCPTLNYSGCIRLCITPAAIVRAASAFSYQFLPFV
ncbi:hypothetical protein H5410_005811 [Solanum commersonii]|uniref:Uncharacterized protein n=1 Tax=Solanum commersonii TaxID=4109 RepID=A0A9J6A7V8_SOLCO|nr:hypothetical protein H5410_005811 [Solanum commersonii]